MTPESLELFQAIIKNDASAVQRALASGADVNATDSTGRNVAAYAALGDAIDSIHMPVQPQLSKHGLEILQLVLEHPDLSLYSLNAPLAWAGGVTLLGLMSWLNMPTEIMCLLEFTQGLVEVNAMDERGATPLMYAARDGCLSVVQRLLAHNARPDLRDMSQHSAVQYALPHPQVLWLCEDVLRRRRSKDSEPPSPISSTIPHPSVPPSSKSNHLVGSLFVPAPTDLLMTPPPLNDFDATELRHTFDSLLRAVHDGDLEALHSLLFLQPPIGPRALGKNTSSSVPNTFLVNFRDTSGLTIVHHAVSQRPCPSIPILDALYRAGADVGIFSTLGFTPLHHLARTARDNVKFVGHEHGYSRPSLTPCMEPLYVFTTHLLRDLHAPLGATDSKGETPLHAAAEHGHSVHVLQAMLDRAAKFTGEESVREARNDRGLRPVDVAKQEFLPLFTRQDHTSSHPPQAHSSAPDLNPRPTLIQRVPSNRSSPNSRPSTGTRLAKKDSNMSLTSRSSRSSSASSSMQSPGSYLSNTSHTSYQSQQSYKQTIPTRMLLTPDPTPPPVLPSEMQELIDVPACALDAISNLSFCAAALHAYSHPDLHEMDLASLPDFPLLSDTLSYAQELALHVLEHWTGRLEVGRRESERLKLELGKAMGVRDRVGKEVMRLIGSSEEHEKGTLAGNPARQRDERDALRSKGKASKDIGIQTDLEDRSVSHAFHRMNTISPRERIDMGAEGRVNGKHVEERTILTGLTNRTDKKPAALKIVKELEKGQDCMVGREIKMPRLRIASESTVDKPSGLDVHTSQQPSSLYGVLSNAPRVLHRAHRDLDGVSAQIAQVHHSFTHAQEALAQARTLLAGALKSRENKLDALIHIHHPDISPLSSRLTPIPERAPDTASSTAISSMGQPPVPSRSTSDARYILATTPIEEPHALRRLLTRKLAQYVGRVFDDLQKARVWLRIVREVLRGLRRRMIEH